MDATRPATEQPRHPAYPWLVCGSLGISAVGAYYLFGYAMGWRWDWADALALWVMLTFGLPAVGDLLGFLVAAWDWLRRPAEPLDPAPPPEAALPALTPMGGGYELSEAERFYFEGLLRTFQHAAAAGSLKSGALIPAAFDNWGHWGYWTDQAAKSGLCVKANGVPTTLPADRTYAWAVGEIRKGNIIWPAEDAPAPQPLPHPFRAGLAYKLTLEKVSKGAEKVGKDEDD
jgi:hypothetical protein